ncbi:MAG: hypothetical protein K2X80_07275 [Pseudomonadaceae bacterium]|nr:hypothetical protein [Pseudomonadaceae bacterium]
MGIKHNYTATGTNDGAKQVSVDRWNAEHTIDSELILPMVSPSAPAADKVAIYGKEIASRAMLCQMGPSGLDTTLQAHLGGNKIALWMPPGGSTTVPGVFGMAALTATGTATLRAIATTNLLTRMTRLAYVSAATAASLAGAREAVAKYTTGAGSGLGGFFARYRFAITDAAAVSGARAFIGLQANTGAPTNVEPSTLVNSLGVCRLSTSSNLWIYGAGASAGTPVDLGVNFPANNPNAAYELALFSPSAGGGYWQVTRLDTGDVASGTFSVVPLGTVLLCNQLWCTNNATALACALDICGIYIETDY